VAGAQAQIYVDCSASSNGSGTLAAPYNTLSSLPSTLGDNATVLIARGCRCDGTIAVNGNNVTIGDYGTGPLPIISGSSVVPDNAWTWDASCQCHTATVPNATKYVYRNGALLTKARTPNANAPDPWYRNNFHDGATLLGSSSLSGLTQAEVENGTAVIRAHNWTYKVIPITGISTTGGFPALQLASNLSDPGFTYNLGYENWGFFMEGKRAFLDVAGEWCWEDGTIYLKTTGETDVPTGIRVATRDFGVRDGSETNTVGLTIHHIAFEHQSGAGIETFVASTTNIHDCDFTQLYRGIKDQSGSTNTNDGHRYQDNTFTDVYDAATLSDATNVQVLGNDLLRIGMVPGLGSTNYGGYQGIRTAGSGVIVRNNRLDQIGYTGIEVQGGGVVEHNFVNAALSTLNDGGGISFDRIDPNLPFPALRVANNICQGIADPSPTLLSTASLASQNGVDFYPYSAYESISYGIYFGNTRIVNTIVEDNTLSGFRAGIHVDHTLCTAGNVVQDNTLYDNDLGLSLSDYSNYTPECGGNGNDGNQGFGGVNYRATYDTRYERNILYAPRPGQFSMRQWNVWASGFGQLVDFGSFARNYYFNPFGEASVLRKVEYNVTDVTKYLGSSDVPYSLRAWRSLGNDLASTQHPLQLSDHGAVTHGALTAFEFNSTLGAYANQTNCSPTLQAGSFLRSVNCSWLEAPGTATTITSNTGPYLLRFRARSGATGITDMIRSGGEFEYTSSVPDGQFRSVRYAALEQDWKDFEFVYDGGELPNRTSQFYVPHLQNVLFSLGAQAQSTFEVDYIRYGACTVAPMDLSGHLLRYNCPLTTTGGQNAGASFTVPGNNSQCWSDVYGNFYAGGEVIDLDEWESIVLFRYSGAPNSTLAFTNGVHTVSGTLTLNTDQNIAGSILVPDGATLIVDGARLGFAPTTPTLTTNVNVKPGGTLILKNGAELTSWIGCGVDGMWDGVKAGGSVSGPQPTITMGVGTRISNAYTALLFMSTNPQNPVAHGTEASILGSGSLPKLILDRAVFENNRYDVIISPLQTASGFALPLVDPDGAGGEDPANGYIRECQFLTTAALKDPTKHPKAHMVLRYLGRLELRACTFKNSIDPEFGSLANRGRGLEVLSASPRVLSRNGVRSTFDGLNYGVFAMGVLKTAIKVDEADFRNNAAGIYMAGTAKPVITRNLFEVPDLNARFKGVDACYGTYLNGVSSFELEENTYRGQNTTRYPKVGAVFLNLGTQATKYYNNTFNNFTDNGRQSCGTIIMGTNASSGGTVGLQMRCNDYSATTNNDFDVAFTGPSVTIATHQGMSGGQPQNPAGNTFALSCNGNDEQHFYLENAVNAFTYFHHLPDQNGLVELVPTCVNTPHGNQNTTVTYEKHDACPEELSGMELIGEDGVKAAAAHAEFDVLKQVYDNWKDGGNTEGLIAFIDDPANSSYQVRNALMLAAPKVSSEAWVQAFRRTVPMNPWHLAQALLANSPLERSVLEMLHRSDIGAFYKELVEDGQNGGVSMHSIYKSEIAHFEAEKSSALQAMVRKSLSSGSSADLQVALDALEDYPAEGMAEEMVQILLTQGELQAARSLVDALQLQGGVDLELWNVYDLVLTALETATPLVSVDPSVLTELETIAGLGALGSAVAEAWLNELDSPKLEVVMLPEKAKRLSAARREKPAATFTPLLQAYPNPSRGPVYLTYTTIEGVEHGELLIHTADGRLAKQIALGNANGIIELQPKELTSGLHIATLYFDGIQVGTTKLNILR
jgi:hypothetical protein